MTLDHSGDDRPPVQIDSSTRSPVDLGRQRLTRLDNGGDAVASEYQRAAEGPSRRMRLVRLAGPHNTIVEHRAPARWHARLQVTAVDKRHLKRELHRLLALQALHCSGERHGSCDSKRSHAGRRRGAGKSHKEGGPRVSRLRPRGPRGSPL